MISGGFFNRHPDLPQWDTPEIAKLMLHYLIQGNPRRIEEDKSQSSGRSLRELAQAAIDSNDPHTTVDLFLEVKETVAAAPNSLVCFQQPSNSKSSYASYSLQGPSVLFSLSVFMHSLICIF